MLRIVLLRMRSLFQRHEVERELDEECRDARRVNLIEDFARDLRYATRTLSRSPGFTAAVALSLALGIGANTAIFSVMDGLMLRMLPVAKPEQLVRLEGTTYSGFLKTTITFDVFPRAVYELFRDHNGVFADVFAFHDLDRPEIGMDGRTEGFGSVQLVSGNFFSALGVNAILGRVVVEDDDSVAVIGYGYWKRRFASDGSAIGKKIVVNNAILEITGVAPPRFFGISPDAAPDLWAPLSIQDRFTVSSAQSDEMNVMARLKHGATAQQGQAELNVLYSQVPENLRFRKGNSGAASMEALPGGRGYSDLREQFSRPLQILTIVVGLVLLTACANVANLLLARATARQTEINTRLAIGAGRARLVRQLLTESLLLAAAGGIAGLTLAWWGNSALLGLLPAGPAPLALHLDARILAFNALVSLLTGILFGLAPALCATRVDLAAGMGRTGTAARTGIRLNKALVVSQVALSLLLLTAAGLFVRSLQKLKTADLGFNPGQMVQVSLDTRGAGYRGPQVVTLYKQLLARLAAIPGVRSVSGVRNGLIKNGNTTTSLNVPGYPLPQPGEQSVASADVGPRFFEVSGLPLISGRDFSDADNATSQKVVAISESLARQYFSGRNPVGLRLGTGPENPSQFEIVAVCKDAKIVTLRRPIEPTIYFPALQRNADRVSAIEIRTAGDATNVIASVRQEVLAINKRLLVSIKTMNQQVDDTLLQERMIGKLSGFFGVLALLLASGGLYGLMAYSVARRTSEIGVRMALGAKRRDVLTMILRETMSLVAIGIAIGVPVSLAAARLAGRWIEGLLFEMEATDPATMVAASLTIALVAILAGYLPARRASRLDPMSALRHE
jgi:predicted permease